MDNTAQSNVTEQSDLPEIARDVPKGLELGLRNYWYPVIESGKVVADEPTGFTMLGEALVAWRDKAGRPCIVRDKCPHRAAKLSQRAGLFSRLVNASASSRRLAIPVALSNAPL